MLAGQCPVRLPHCRVRSDFPSDDHDEHGRHAYGFTRERSRVIAAAASWSQVSPCDDRRNGCRDRALSGRCIVCKSHSHRAQAFRQSGLLYAWRLRPGFAHHISTATGSRATGIPNWRVNLFHESQCLLELHKSWNFSASNFPRRRPLGDSPHLEILPGTNPILPMAWCPVTDSFNASVRTSL
jgi:hypothetical protein